MNDEIKDKIQKVCDIYSKFCNTKFRTSLPVPSRVKFDLETTDPKCAGMAYSFDLSISLNGILLKNNISEFLNQIIPHELAHLVVFQKYNHLGVDTQGHGAEWQLVMKKLGKKADRYHKMNTKEAIIFHKNNKQLKNGI